MLPEKNNTEDNRNKEKNTPLQPAPGTVHTTDPQENMEGPFSSPMHKAGNKFDTNETKEEADEKKDRNL